MDTFTNPELARLVPDDILEETAIALNRVGKDIKDVEDFLKRLPIPDFRIKTEFGDMSWTLGRVSFAETNFSMMKPLIEHKCYIRIQCAPYLGHLIEKGITLAKNVSARTVAVSPP